MCEHGYNGAHASSRTHPWRADRRGEGPALIAAAVLAPLVFAILAAPVAAAAGKARAGLAAPVGAALAGLAFAATLYGWLSGGGVVDVPWAPTLDLRFDVALDGHAVMYSLLATGIGFAVLVYSSRYLPLHLAHERRPQTESTRFYFFILLFMGAMVGLAMARDLILLFLFWDITAIASYYLIGYDRHRHESRYSALMALLVTGITAVLLLIGALMFYVAYGTFSVPEIAGRVEPGALLVTAGLLILLAAFAKSAQVPFHFWLPRAMAAPTPVSAYLHSAAMVAAGVLLIGRVYPILAQSDTLLAIMSAAGLLSIAVGGTLALTRDALKQLLAYSTISQYGYVVLMFGMGGKYGAVGALFYVIAHALAKSALFLTSGAVTEATGESRLSRLGGLARRMPLLAAGSGAAAAGLAALPLTIGFFKDELFFAAALAQGGFFPALTVAAAVLTLAYTWRFWAGIFLGEPSGETREIPPALVAPVAALGALVFAGGVFVGPFAELARSAGATIYAGPVGSVEPAYHLDLRPENLMALATFAFGAVVVLSRRYWRGVALAFARLGELAGPDRIYELSLRWINRLSYQVHNYEVRDLRGRVAAVLVPAGVLIALGLAATPADGVFEFGGVSGSDVPLLLTLLAASVASLAACFVRRHIMLAVVVSGSGFSIAVAYAFFGAPDVALVAVLIETVLTLLILGTLRLIPRGVLQRAAKIPPTYLRRKVFTAVLAGAFMMAISWSTLSQGTPEQNVAEEYLRLTPEAHGKDAVTVILADFRGLDTLGEITVVALVLLGAATLLNRGRLP
ncbi:MAG: hydrogen gas-evolving membrane-bound hydrogenase subunit E [Actinomycetota bacterium]